MNIPQYRLLNPSQAGDPSGDYYFEFNGERSESGYASRSGARAALHRRMNRWFQEQNND